MHHFSPLFCKLLLGLLFLGIGFQSIAQEKAVDSLLISKKDSLIVRSDQDTKQDSLPPDFIPTLDELIKKGKRFSLQSSEIQLELEKSLDTTYLESEITDLLQVVKAMEDRKELSNKNYNFRYVNALDRILERTLEHTNEIDKIIQDKLDRLSNLDSLLGSIRNDNFFKFKIRDSLLLPNYSLEINLLKKNIQSIDSAIFYQELQAARFQSQLSLLTIQIRGLNDYVEKSKAVLEKSLLSKEINFLWEDYSIPSPKSILRITRDSMELNWTFFKQQFTSHKLSTFMALLILIGAVFLVISTIHKLRRESEDSNQHTILGKLIYLNKTPAIGVIIALTPILLFLFDLGSISFITFILLMQVILTTFVIFRSYEKHLSIKWILICLVFLFFTLSNLYWEIAYQERMYYLLGDALVIFLLSGPNRKFKSNISSETTLITIARGFTVTLLSLSILCNLLGRFSLAKVLSVAGIAGFAHSITLFFFVKFLTEIIFLLIENNKETDSITAFLNFREIQKRLQNLLIAFSLVVWVIILLQNLALNHYFMDWLSEILSKERKLGDTAFTFGSLLLFGGLVYLSSIISNNVAYFISLKDQKTTDASAKKLGSSVLIIRLLVLTFGFFIAATAAKIPLDKITIVLGALSVGIGFGLQTIINNLVSGIILAFERPIQIGDDIEVGDMTGKVKEVGIRASKIQAYDGSEIIVPNGDLLSQSLINWTLSDKRRRIELIIGVAYDSDMKKVKELITKEIQRDRIMKYPEPKVYMQNFGESSVDFRVLFWVDTMDIYLEMRNEIMNSIFESFLENGIEIPFPKRDLYIKSLPELKSRIEDENKKSPEN